MVHLINLLELLVWKDIKKSVKAGRFGLILWEAKWKVLYSVQLPDTIIIIPDSVNIILHPSREWSSGKTACLKIYCIDFLEIRMYLKTKGKPHWCE